MCFSAVTLLVLRSVIKIGELSLDSVLWLIGGGIALSIVWLVAERIAAIAPGLLHCNVCGERIKGVELLQNLRPAEPLSYPFRLPDGTRSEQPVQSLCPKCVRRARRHRESDMRDA